MQKVQLNYNNYFINKLKLMEKSYNNIYYYFTEATLYYSRSSLFRIVALV